MLNFECGSDYFYNFPKDSPNLPDKIAHLDGDGDRLIYTLRFNEKRAILDGNYILGLLVKYFLSLEFEVVAFCDEITSEKCINYIK